MQCVTEWVTWLLILGSYNLQNCSKSILLFYGRYFETNGYIFFLLNFYIKLFYAELCFIQRENARPYFSL